MKKVIFIVFIMIIVSSCGKSDFDIYMDKGRDSLRIEDYNEALKQFNFALIEKPTIKDVLALIDMSQKGMTNQKRKEFLVSADKIINRITQIGSMINEDANNITVDEARKELPELKELLEKSLEHKRNFQNDEIMSSLSSSLFKASNSIHGAYERIIEDIHEPLIVEGSGVFAKRRAELKSNDSRIRAKNGMQDFWREIEYYKSELAKVNIE